jgi:hypothetical protein
VELGGELLPNIDDGLDDTLFDCAFESLISGRETEVKPLIIGWHGGQTVVVEEDAKEFAE